MTAPQNQWSKEPWTVGQVEFCEDRDLFNCSIGAGDVYLITIWHEDEEQVKANAARIVACVNQRKEFEDYVAELTGGYDDALTALKAFVEQIRDESAELNASVEKLLADNSKLTQQANKEGWISVDERLPENPRKVLVAFDSNCQVIARFSEESGWTYGEHDSEADGVTYWRELPPPPLSQPSPVEAQKDEPITTDEQI